MTELSKLKQELVAVASNANAALSRIAEIERQTSIDSSDNRLAEEVAELRDLVETNITGSASGRREIIGLEEARRDFFGLSKSAFYGPRGPARNLPIIQLSSRRKAVKLADCERYVASRTKPAEAGAGS